MAGADVSASATPRWFQAEGGGGVVIVAAW